MSVALTPNKTLFIERGSAPDFVHGLYVVCQPLP